MEESDRDLQTYRYLDVDICGIEQLNAAVQKLIAKPTRGENRATSEQFPLRYRDASPAR
jgi:hypothetical protein